MANRPAPGLVLREGDRKRLQALTRSSTAPAGLAQRTRIVLLAADGESNTAIAEKVGVSRPTVIAWRDRYQSHGLAGLEDEPRSGRPRAIDRAQVIAVTLAPPPDRYGVTHWSSPLLARHLRISDHSVATIWREAGVQPWRAESFRFSTDPELEAKVIDVVGLYLKALWDASSRHNSCHDSASDDGSRDLIASTRPRGARGSAGVSRSAGFLRTVSSWT